jgi:hypothetical protein
MKLFSWQRHSSWARLAGEYADGSIDPRQAAAFDAHRSNCARCRGHVAETNDLRALLQRLPDLEPARSFRIDAAMLAGSTPLPRAEAAPASTPARRTRAVNTGMRFAAGLSAAALGAVVLLDFALPASSDDGGTTAASPAFESLAVEEDGSAAPSAEDLQRAAEQPSELPGYEGDDGISGSSAGGEDDAEALPTGTPQLFDNDRELNDGTDEAAPEDAQITALQPQSSDGGWDRDGVLRGLQIALAAALVAALGGMVLFPARRRLR